MAETPTPASESKSIHPAQPEIKAAPATHEGKEGEGFAGFFELLGMVVDTEVALDAMKGEKRDLGDIMKDVLASAEEKLADAKAAREGKK